VRGASPASSFRAYYNNPEATAGALRGEWLYTGDLARQDETATSISSDARRTACGAEEDVSAWEVERVFTIIRTWRNAPFTESRTSWLTRNSSS